eukprot:TRINITY_DN14980_c0_g3_i1.p1 TRINITY_DN14980_c0_g3~~TRINITY_DN14980_c0_g3_i1.p1  ORF type:complete len:520 (+),score=155.86 TRINITY_DN14980_c0_g3_i1:124-1683(+)
MGGQQSAEEKAAESTEVETTTSADPAPLEKEALAAIGREVGTALKASGQLLNGKPITDGRSFFHACDKDGNGYLDGTEIGDALRSLNIAIEPQHLQQLIRSLDANANGKVELAELVRVFDGKELAVIEAEEACAAAATAASAAPAAPAGQSPAAKAASTTPAATSPKEKETAKAKAKSVAPKVASPVKVQSAVPQQPGLISEESQAATKKGKGAKKGKDQGVQLCVRNLTRECTAETLKELFQPFGALTSVDVKKGADGVCKGFGFVSFSSKEAATKAIAGVHNKKMGGKSLVVVLSDHQQGTSKAEREGDKGKGAGKGKGMPTAPDATKGKVAEAGGKGKTRAAPPAPIVTDNQYPYSYNYSLLQQMYANQAYSPQAYPAQAFQQAMQAQILQAHAQALSAQAYYSQLANQAIVPGASAISAASISSSAASETAAKAALVSKAGGEGRDYEGILKSISTKNGYGFISCNETKELLKRDVFVDSSLLPGDLNVGDKVCFALTLSEKGHPRATTVRKVVK